MIKKVFIISLTALISQIVFCQQGWYQLTSGTSNNLRSVYFTDVNTGYAVGISGTILKTTNGGLNWISNPGLTFENLNSVHFIGQTGYVVGGYSNPVILKTSNGGINWSEQNSAGARGLNSVFITDPVTAYITSSYESAPDGKILKTTNGGINWSVIHNVQWVCYFSVFFLNNNTGYVTWRNCIHAGGGLQYTTDGGSSWVYKAGEGVLYFTNPITGYRGGYGNIFKTTDGAASWTSQLLGSNISAISICFANETTGYTAGNLYPSIIGKIFKTTNAGTNWFEQTVLTTSQLNSINFAEINTGYAVGNSGTILKTTNGGVTGLNIISNEIPKDYKLFQNYPNPFNPVTKIIFSIPSSETHSNASLRVFDILGREVVTLVDEELKPGVYEIDFDAENYSSGIYYYVLKTGDFLETKKMILIK